MAPSSREHQLEKRSLASLATAHSDFLTHGQGNVALAKEYFNAIARPFFDLPLDQVVNKVSGDLLW